MHAGGFQTRALTASPAKVTFCWHMPCSVSTMKMDLERCKSSFPADGEHVLPHLCFWGWSYLQSSSSSLMLEEFESSSFFSF